MNLICSADRKTDEETDGQTEQEIIQASLS